MFRKNETKSLLKARTIALKNAEIKVEQRNKMIKDMQEEAEVLIGANADLRFENEELKLFKDKVISIMTSKGTIVSKHDKIIELVSDYQSLN